MRQNPSFAMSDVAELRRLIERNPWTTLVSSTPDGLVASHYAVLLDEGRDDLTIVGHVGKPDDMIHGLGERELMIVVQGPHGYVSPGWYGDVASVPTWNFVSAHLTGVPDILSPEENLQVLDRLVAHFENVLPEPYLMRQTLENAAYAERIVHGTVGFRLRVERFEAKEKMSQDKPAEVVDRVIDALGDPGPYRNPALAARMSRVHGREQRA